MRILAAGLLVLSLIVAECAGQGTKVILDLSRSPQIIVAKLGNIDSKTVRASVEPGELFPILNSQWRGAGEVVGSSSAIQTYYKVWKGDLDDISLDNPAVLVYQQPVRVGDSYGGYHFELRDINVATDFSLKRKAKAVQL